MRRSEGTGFTKRGFLAESKRGQNCGFSGEAACRAAEMPWAITSFSQMILAYGIGHGIRDHGVSEYPCSLRKHHDRDPRQDSEIELFSRTVQF